jgi:hypothetical protein
MSKTLAQNGFSLLTTSRNYPSHRTLSRDGRAMECLCPLTLCVSRSILHPPPKTPKRRSESTSPPPRGFDIVRSRTLVRPRTLRVGTPWTASGRWGRQAADHRESHWRAFSVTAKCRFDTAMLRGAIELLPSGPTAHSGTDRRPAETFRNARAPRVSRVVTILHKFSVNRVLSASWRSPASGDRWHPGSNFGDVSGDGEQSHAQATRHPHSTSCIGCRWRRSQRSPGRPSDGSARAAHAPAQPPRARVGRLTPSDSHRPLAGN